MSARLVFAIALSCLIISFTGNTRSFAIAIFVEGDIDGDGDVDNADLATIAGNGGLLGAFPSDGDVDLDNDVDADDFEIAAGNYGSTAVSTGLTGQYFGPITLDSTPAQLLYNSATGEVLLDQTNAPGGVISNFILFSLNSSFLPPDPNDLPFGEELGASEVALIANSDPNSFSPSAGFPSNPHSLGSILPAGLDSSTLPLEVTQAVYVGETGTGVREFALVVIPEPATLALALVGLCVSFRRRC